MPSTFAFVYLRVEINFSLFTKYLGKFFSSLKEDHSIRFFSEKIENDSILFCFVFSKSFLIISEFYDNVSSSSQTHQYESSWKRSNKKHMNTQMSWIFRNNFEKNFSSIFRKSSKKNFLREFLFTKKFLSFSKKSFKYLESISCSHFSPNQSTKKNLHHSFKCFFRKKFQWIFLLNQSKI